MNKEIEFLLWVLGLVLGILLVLFILSRISAKVRQFFWFCAGVNISLLKKCPNDYNRYSNIGATIFFTAILAWMSMGYALNSVFHSLPLSILFGFIWCLMIFTLDRTIVSSMQKPNEKVTFKDFDFWRESLFALIRIGIAIIISLVIMKPIEIKIFEDRLVAEIKNMNDDQAKNDSSAIETRLGIGELAKEIDQARADKEELETQLGQEPKTQRYRNLKSELSQCNQSLSKIRESNNAQIFQNNVNIEKTRKDFTVPMEINGVVQAILNAEGRKKIADLNFLNRKLMGEISIQNFKCNQISNDMKKEREQYQNRIEEDLTNISDRIIKKEAVKDTVEVKAQTISKQDEAIRAISFQNSLVTQIEALGRLTSKDKTMGWVSFFIMLIFIAIETAPILAKLIAKRGDYDERLELERYKLLIRQEYSKSKIKAEINRGVAELKVIDEKIRRVVESREEAFVEMSSKKIKLQLQKELENNEALLYMISEAQKEIAELVVRQWKEQELEKLKNQIQSNSSQSPST